jgi:hypothetical protein
MGTQRQGVLLLNVLYDIAALRFCQQNHGFSVNLFYAD